jgi:mRNA-degrading endonuclease RelE of RelBE toxin-antitoxin system/rhodanese-related sulfurtransferase
MTGYRPDIPPRIAEIVRHLPPELKRDIKQALRSLSADPFFGTPLIGELRGLWRIKVRRFRIVYAPDRNTRLIRIFAIAHRREVYEKTTELLRRNQKLKTWPYPVIRQPIDIEAFPQMIPGAIRIAMEEIEERHGEIPRDRDVVLYCSWPNEATSARVALLLRAKGITRVRPLEGGIDAWLADDFPFVTENLVEKPVVLWRRAGRIEWKTSWNQERFKVAAALHWLSAGF